MSTAEVTPGTVPAVVHIGKKEYTLAPLVFDQMERVWPYLKKHTEPMTDDKLKDLSLDDIRNAEMQAARDSINVLVIGLENNVEACREGFTVPEKQQNDPKAYEAAATKIRKTMLAGEIPLIRTSILSLLEISGLTPVGNVSMELGPDLITQLQQLIGSTEISPQSSGFSSLAESKEAAGT